VTPELPRYVPRSGELVYAPPYDAFGTHVLAWALRADERRMNALLARYFNEPSGGAVDFRAAMPLVMLTLADIANLRPAEVPGNRQGFTREKEVAVWMPVIDAARDQLVWFHPYLFVDSGIAMAAGREVHGFHKQVGTITLGDARTVGPLVQLDVTGIPRFAPDAPYAQHRLLDVVQKGAPGGVFQEIEMIGAGVEAALRGAREILKTLGGGFGGLIDEARLLGHMARELAARTCTMVFLKEFRDAVQPDRACYQAVVQAASRIVTFRGGGLLGECAVTLNDLDTQPLREDLGLAAGVLTPIASWWLAYDFVLEPGTELWKARP
jgi:hypothetical protein